MKSHDRPRRRLTLRLFRYLISYPMGQVLVEFGRRWLLGAGDETPQPVRPEAIAEAAHGL